MSGYIEWLREFNEMWDEMFERPRTGFYNSMVVTKTTTKTVTRGGVSQQEHEKLKAKCGQLQSILRNRGK